MRDEEDRNGLAVSCSGLTRSFSSGSTRTMALRGIDLDVRYGEAVMLVGPSGCGKTTLISVIAAILDADGGRCAVLGHDLGAMTNRQKTAFRRQFVGFVFQSFNLLPKLTAVQNVAIPLLIAGARRPAALGAAAKLLAGVGLADRIDARPEELSGGQQQRVAVARALVHRPRLVVCDEPTSALDHHTGQSLMTLLRETALDDGRALIIVTHDARILPFADRIAEMDDGRVVQLRTAKPATAVRQASEDAR